MPKNLVIVESPAKAKTIEKFLGKDFLVMSSFGHVRDLPKSGINIDFSNNYAPNYVVSDDKKRVVSDLKKAAKSAETIWLASDEDREGEAIAWHLYEVLGLKEENTRRIVFHEITKTAILKSIENPRAIDINLVNAQQARRVLDRIVGFELSPVLWKKIRPSLSAGRVQSVAVRLIVEREREIDNFASKSAYRVSAIFESTDKNGKEVSLKSELNHRFATKEEAEKFLEHCKTADFKISDIVTKPSKKSPAAPFTTSTLQQEASRKLGFSVSQTMMVAQRLYESGKITYMRTDSVNLSTLAIDASKAEIISMAGEKYVKTRQFSNKSKGAQEAHEAIRPTSMNVHSAGATAQEKKLYEMIWKRTIASQMADALLEKTTIHIDISGIKFQFLANGEVLIFDGFLSVFLESTDDETEQEEQGMLPAMNVNEILKLAILTAQERYSQQPPRYTEASLVRKLEELGIGRPSTYAPTISTIQQRLYVEKGNRDPKTRQINILTLKDNQIIDDTKTENYGAEKAKLFPTDIGMVVTDFLKEHFPNIMSFDFTANVEKEFDHIADGEIDWAKTIDSFYQKFHPNVQETLQNSERQVGERVLGTDPKTGRQLSVKIGRYGPVAQIGTADEEEKPLFASLQKDQSIEHITAEEALKLFAFPRKLGQYEESELTVAIGRFGPYVRHKDKFYSLPKELSPAAVTLDECIEVIETKREEDKNKIIHLFGENQEIQVLNGRYGPYISYEKKNYKIPKTIDPSGLTLESVMELINSQPKDDKKKSTKKTGTTTKKAAAKKTTAAKKTSSKRAAKNN